MTGQISNKVSVGTLSGAAVSVITWALTAYIPAFHNGLPPSLAALLPAIVGAAGCFAGGYIARHYPAADEVAREALRIVGAVQQATEPVPARKVTGTA